MMPTSSGLIDFGILGLIGFSMFIGLMRGATREILGISGWVGAFVTSFYGLPLFRPLGRECIRSPLIADIVVGGILFIFSLSVFIILSRTLSSKVKGSPLNEVDRSFGLVFGFVRGVVVVSLLYFLFGFFRSETTLPYVLQNARFIPWVEDGAFLLRSLIPEAYLPHEGTPLSYEGVPIFQRKTLPTPEETVNNLSILKPTSPSTKSP